MNVGAEAAPVRTGADHRARASRDLGRGNRRRHRPAALGWQALAGLELAVDTETPDHYFAKFKRMGGVVEEFIEASEKTSPSAQFRTSPRGEVLATSTHDQILGGPSGQIYLGCSFPARDDYEAHDALLSLIHI